MEGGSLSADRAATGGSRLYLSEDGFAALLEALPDGTLVVDSAGRIVLVNRRLEEMSGYDRADLLGDALETLVPERVRISHARWRTVGDASRRPPAPPPGAEMFLRRRDGAELPVDVKLNVLEGQAEPLFVASIRDVTDRRRAEAAALESERRWRSVLENVQLIVVGLDHEGSIIYANPFLLRSTGYAPEEVLGRDWFEILLPQQESGRVRIAFRELLEGDQHTYRVNAILTKTGERRSVAWYNTVLRDADGTPIGTLSIGEDITERSRAQARLRASTEVIRAILDGTDPDEVLALIARRARELVGAALASVATAEADADHVVVRTADGPVAEGLTGTVIPLKGSLAGEVLRVRHPLVVTDAAGDPRAYRPAIRGFGPMLLVPLARRGSFGVLVVGNRVGGRAFTEEDAAVVQLFASQAAMALEYARAQAELRRLTVLEDRERIARELHDGIIQSLFATGLHLQAAAARRPDDEIARRAERAVVEIDRVIRDLRRYIFGLRPGPSEGPALEDELRLLAADVEERAGVTATVEVDPRAVE